ncbi:hypothetical protein SAMN02745164_02113 [Marinitoga hydrogenitolerans DSM 16785]|uniref:Uncharacterized protein n=1 Tax=Marinitoga hydrogenitolerans (strain DSM 16785 / JCM 12826 / AT1271) TaxID=1122195 RepID=A0A1M5A673_MARH1|nr:hypothetical protein [Marinitoga hydrogenitolerans]SHF25803.1 hypothetical protein SAMN02745164_02113 [Marinitoga hydrogenitolerans DSM 16785]
MYSKYYEDFLNKIKTTFLLPHYKKNDKYICFYYTFNENGEKNFEDNIDYYEWIDNLISIKEGTALINGNNKTNFEGTLHSEEFINEKIVINNEIKNVYWVGYLEISENNEVVNNIKQYLQEKHEIYIGGNITSGYGKVEIIIFEKVESKTPFDEDLNKNKKNYWFPILLSTNQKENKEKFEIIGNILNYYGRRFEKDNSGGKYGYGQKRGEPIIFIEPGNYIKNLDNYFINPNGFIVIGDEKK